MKAVGYLNSLPIENPDSLLDLDVEQPVPGDRDLLVEVKAISVNPIDAKIRLRAQPDPGHYKILGWDVAGTVKQVGSDVSLFKVGDDVYYAGSITRQGANSELHVVDERIVGKKPKSVSFAEAAALPLTTITAWELLFDRFDIRIGKPVNAGSLLIVGGAGGVGSIMIQLAKKLTGLTVIATASRPESFAWCTKLGADYVVDHTKPLGDQLSAIGYPAVDYVASLTGTEAHFPSLAGILAPQGKFGLIDDPKILDVTLLKQKAASLHWEYMFARSTFQTEDAISQHNLLNEVSALVDAGMIVTTLTEVFGTINAQNMKRAHSLIETRKSLGKIVLAGF